MMGPSDVANAETRNVVIAPARCECGRTLRWDEVTMATGLGTAILRRWEYATCSRCCIIWHHDLLAPHIVH